MFKRKGFTIVELLVTVLIIGIIAAIGLPNYVAMKEKSLNREATSVLALIRAAEKVYRMEEGFYYPYLSSTAVTSNINTALKLSLSENAAATWSVNVNGIVNRGQASRATGDGRVWTINFPGDTDPTCAGGTYCP